ncbi:MAG: hypothetical protein II793_01090 [Bacteroidales bacterium]|nr:hypothetical protein [Bacteroidales bacterium]
MHTTKHSITLLFAAAMITTAIVSCKDDDKTEAEAIVGLPDYLVEETYAGGQLGTTFNSTASAYEDPAPAVEEAGMANEFKYGEYFFERPFTTNNKPFNGLGPLYIRNSCEACHPGYGHGKRMTRYRADDWGNGYLLVCYDKRNNAYLTSLTGMPQTKAVAPFKAPLDETKINIAWLNYTDEWGNKFPDGEGYELIYPEVTIPQDAYYIPFGEGGEPVPYEHVGVLLEGTIGIYGSGLIDAIPDDSLKAQYQKEYNDGYMQNGINPGMWAGTDWAATGLYGNTNHPKRYTYALTRGPLQDAPGSNAIWNITNVTRSNKQAHYMTAIYANIAKNDPEVRRDFYRYFPTMNITGDTAQDIYNYLIYATDEVKQRLEPEMSDKDYVNFMVWHRGLAVPAARNLGDAEVQRGRQVFREIGCAYCHRPSWNTGDDIFTDPSGFFADGDSRLPRFPHQKIWPYSDFVQHKLMMKNDIRTGWCRTTPLWGRGLSAICTGAADRLHDYRARNVIEAIMWHGAPNSDARRSVEKFRQLNKSDRDAVVKFINAI